MLGLHLTPSREHPWECNRRVWGPWKGREAETSPADGYGGRKTV